MAWKASWAHRTGENEEKKKKDNDKIKTTLGAGRIFIKSIMIVCLKNLMAWKASWAHRTGENEEKKKRK